MLVNTNYVLYCKYFPLTYNIAVNPISGYEYRYTTSYRARFYSRSDFIACKVLKDGVDRGEDVP